MLATIILFKTMTWLAKIKKLWLWLATNIACHGNILIESYFFMKSKYEHVKNSTSTSQTKSMHLGGADNKSLICNEQIVSSSCDMINELHRAKWGPVHISGICTLLINIINEKIYLIIWFWYLLMNIMSTKIDSN